MISHYESKIYQEIQWYDEEILACCLLSQQFESYRFRLYDMRIINLCGLPLVNILIIVSCLFDNMTIHDSGILHHDYHFGLHLRLIS